MPPGSSLRIRPDAGREITVAPEDRETLRGDREAVGEPERNDIEWVTPEQAAELPGIEQLGALRDLVEVIPADGPLELPLIERRGNPTTRAEIARASTRLHECLENHNLRRCTGRNGCRDGNCNYVQRGGTDENGQPIPEQRIPPLDRSGSPIQGTSRNASYADIEITFCRSRRRLLINTYTPQGPSLRPDRRERWQAVRMLWNARKGDMLFMIPKAPDGTEWDFGPLCGMLDDSIVELQRPFADQWSSIGREIRRRMRELRFPRR